jgi:predicted metal-dependent HD superfamily phosphohydrolase
MPVNLENYWREAWSGLGCAAPADAFTLLIDNYSQPQRHYHSLQHLQECFEKFEMLRTQCAAPSEVLLALWYHDAVYDTQAKDNEETSAALATTAMRAAGIVETCVARVHDLIMATRHSAEPTTADQAILLDIDLSILGAERERFAEYEQQIRNEYAWVPEELYRSGRTQVLNTFLQRPRIYSSVEFFTRYEVRARHNLQEAIDTLEEFK